MVGMQFAHDAQLYTQQSSLLASYLGLTFPIHANVNRATSDVLGTALCALLEHTKIMFRSSMLKSVFMKHALYVQMVPLISSVAKIQSLSAKPVIIQL